MKEIILESYTPTVLNVKNKIPVGISVSNSLIGEDVKIIQKGFITSKENNFLSATGLFKQFFKGNRVDEYLNKLLIIIKNDEIAYIYNNFPMMVLTMLRNKTKKKKGDLIFENEILDIKEVLFENEYSKIEINEKDKIIFLFRKNWIFGLFFDLTGKLEIDYLKKEIANCYRYLLHLEIYEVFEEKKNYKKLIDEGWFPFAELILNKDYTKILIYFDENKKRRDDLLKSLIEKYDSKEIKNICSKWWNNKIFKGKKEILEAGIESYLRNDKKGIILAIKALSTEIEGILRNALNLDTEFKNKKDYKKFIKEIGIRKYENNNMLFPDKFYEYLISSVFCDFNIDKKDNKPSRHLFAHGLANNKKYTKIRCFQIILTLDQIYYFLN